MDKYQVLRPLTSEEYNELKESIRLSGVIYSPILIDEHGDIIDGYHRQRIYEELTAEGLQINVTKKAIANLDTEQKLQIAFEVNAVRRQMTQEQVAEARTQVGRRKAAEQSLRQSPQMADRWHASQIGISKNTVADVRKELESGGQIDQLGRLIGVDGKQYPRQIERKPLIVPNATEESVSKIKNFVETAAPEYVNAAAEGKISVSDAVTLAHFCPVEDQVEAVRKVDAGEVSSVLDGLNQAKSGRIEKDGLSEYQPPKVDEEEQREILISNVHKAFYTICEKVSYLRDDYSNIAWCLLAAGNTKADLIDDVSRCVDRLQNIKAALCKKDTKFLQVVK